MSKNVLFVCFLLSFQLNANPSISYEEIIQTIAIEASQYESSPWGKKYDEIIYSLKELANQGDVKAMYGLAIIYAERSRMHDGKGDNELAEKESFRWMTKAAEKGHNGALLELSRSHYFSDEHKSKEYVIKAFKSGSKKAKDIVVNSVGHQLLSSEINKELIELRQKANSGNKTAQETLASKKDLFEGRRFDAYKQAMNLSDNELISFYLNENSYPFIKSDEATIWWDKLAENSTDKLPYTVGKLFQDKEYNKLFNLLEKYSSNGNYRAKAWLGVMYISGDGVLKDYIKALSLLREAEKISKQDGVVADLAREADLTEEQLMPFYKWYAKQAEKGDLQAQVDLAKMYERGNSYFKQNSNQSIFWLEKAAKKNHLNAINKLAEVYKSKYHTSKNMDALKQSIMWYTKAANNGNIDAMKYLGSIYMDSTYGLRNYTEARKWFLKAADNNNSYGLQGLGRLFYYGLGVQQDSALSFKYFEKAGSMSYADSMLKYMYYIGDGVEQNFKITVDKYLSNDINSYQVPYGSQCSTILAELGNNFIYEQCLFEANDWDERDFRLNFNQLLFLAENGALQSQLAVGNIYYDSGDYKNAKKWFDKIFSSTKMVDYFKWEENGRKYGSTFDQSYTSYNFILNLFIVSNIKLAKIYEHGLETDRNADLSNMYLDRAAKLIAISTINTLEYYDREIDEKAVATWYLKGTQLGDQVSANFLLSHLYNDNPAKYAVINLLNMTPYSYEESHMTAEEIELGQKLAQNPKELWKRIQNTISKTKK